MEAVSKDFGSKRRRIMTYGGCTVNVGDVVEMESQGHLILTVNGEVKTGEVEIGEINLIFKFISSSISPHPQSDGRDENHGRGENHGGCGQHPRKSELNELISLDKVSVTCLLQQVILAT
ncbi:hypothetical protein Acr_22g0006840 [Actinidia rufa]|uniref:Uncharacterized protein n=1 Tax=Actinidia rufa TaxID=165716 RepID=A0A7J0GKF3_9ERIC|nr:hypothetical protein Acr_22g0006840 [Actinidia rufa]